jgi:hypothetical protein
MMTMADLLDGMLAEGRLEAEAPERIAATLAARRPEGAPWYLHLLVGFGSWIAALLLLVSFGIAGLIDGGGEAVMLGLLLCAAAAVARATVARAGVLTQVPLAPALTGALMVTMGIWLSGGGFLGPGGEWSFSLALGGLATLEAVMIVAYRDWLHRFIAAVVVCVAVCGILLTNELHLAAALLAAGLGWAVALAWQHEARLARYEALARPVLLGLSLGLLAVVWMILLTPDSLDWLASIGLATALAWQAWGLLAGARPALRGAAVAAVAALLCVAWGAPGLLAAPLVVAAGFSRGSRPVVAVGALFLASYLIFYYYNLELTLLVKSLVLLASGLALLGARAGLARLKLL